MYVSVSRLVIETIKYFGHIIYDIEETYALLKSAKRSHLLYFSSVSTIRMYITDVSVAVIHVHYTTGKKCILLRCQCFMI